MISLALSLLLTIAPPQQRQSNPVLDFSLLALACSLPVALCWRWIVDDESNQPPVLTVLPGGASEVEVGADDFVQNEADVEPEEAGAQGEFDRLLDAIDFESAAPAAPSVPELIIPRAVGSLGGVRPPAGGIDPGVILEIPLLQRQAWLTEYLHEVKLEYLLQFMQATPIAVVGLERCGKNTFAMAICALRRIYFPMPMIACSPHANGDNPFPAFFSRVGRGDSADYGAIAAQLRALRAWVELGDTTPVTTLWDESSSYPVKFALKDRGVLDAFLLFCMTECAKHEKFQILLASGTTNSCLPGAEGTAEIRGKGIVTVHRHVHRDGFGRKSPSPNIVIESDAGRTEKEFPKWLNASWILQLFPEVNQPIPLPDCLGGLGQLPSLPGGGSDPEVTTAPEVPTTVRSEVTSGVVEVREVKASNVIYLPTSTSTSASTSTPGSAPEVPRKLLFLAVSSHLGSGKSITWVVEEVFRMKGRKFAEGRKLIEDLIEEFGGSDDRAN